MDFPNFNDLFRIARDKILASNSKLSRDAVERAGMDANALTAAAAETGDEVVGQLVDVEAGLYLDSAEEVQLDRLVFDRYQLVRKAAAAAMGTVQFTTTAANPVAFTIPKGTQLQTTGGNQYVTLADVTFPLGTAGPVEVSVRSTLAGTSQQAKAGSITSIAGQIPGQPADLQVNNAVATFGADDQESDASLRDRARRFFTTARRGTLAAIESGALAIPGVRKATAFETLDSLGRPGRYVNLVISDAFTDQFVTYDTVPPAYLTQSSALSGVVFAGLADVRAAGIFVLVQVGIVVLQPLQLQLVFSAGSDVDAVTAQAKAAAVNYLNGLAPGAPLVVQDLGDAVRAVAGLIATGQEIASPPGDVVPQPLQVLRCSLQLVSIAK